MRSPPSSMSGVDAVTSSVIGLAQATSWRRVRPSLVSAATNHIRIRYRSGAGGPFVPPGSLRSSTSTRKTTLRLSRLLLVGLELATSAVLFTTKVCTAPQAGTPPPKRKAAPTRAEGSFHARRRWIIGACARLSGLGAAARDDGDDSEDLRTDRSPT